MISQRSKPLTIQKNANYKYFLSQASKKFKTWTASTWFKIRPTPRNAANLLQRMLAQRIVKPTIQQDFDFICINHAHDMQVCNPATAFFNINNTDKIVEVFIKSLTDENMISKHPSGTSSKKNKAQLIVKYVDSMLKIRTLMDDIIKKNKFTTEHFNKYWRLNDEKEKSLGNIKKIYTLSSVMDKEIQESAQQNIDKLDPERKKMFSKLAHFKIVFFPEIYLSRNQSCRHD